MPPATGAEYLQKNVSACTLPKCALVFLDLVKKLVKDIGSGTLTAASRYAHRREIV